MRYRTALIAFTVFMVLSVVVTTLVYGTLSREASGPTDTYTALFTDVTGLKQGDDVRVAGVRVGRVDAVDLEGTKAKVTFRLQRDQVIYSDTIASIVYQNIVGQRYLGLTRRPGERAAGRLPAGSQIPLDRTQPSFDVGALLNGFEPLFTLLDPAQANKLSGALITAFQGDHGAVTQLVLQTAEVTQAFAGRDATLDRTIDDLNTLVGNMSRQNHNLDQVISQAHSMVTDLNARRENMVGSLGALKHVAERISTISDTSYPQLQEMLHREPGVAQHIVDIQDQVAFMGDNLPAVMKGLARLSQDGSYGNGYVCSLNILGFFPGLNDLIPQIVRLASPGNVVKYSQKCRPAR